MTERPRRQPLSHRARFWLHVHRRLNHVAWRWARPPGETWGIALRINHRHPLWRLNDWAAAKYPFDQACGTKAFMVTKPCERARRALLGEQVNG